MHKVRLRERLERYRSGHNEAVLKTVCPKGRVGSNPTLSVNCSAELSKMSSWYRIEYQIPKGM